MAALGVMLAMAGCGGGSPSGPTPGGNAPPQATPTPTPQATPAPTPTPTPTPSQPTVLRATSFQGANGYSTEGRAAIVAEAGRYRLELRSDFRTSQSGALDVRLCRETGCRGGDLNLGAIKAFSGAQSYELPDDGSAYSYVVIWCRAVALPFGFGELR